MGWEELDMLHNMFFGVLAFACFLGFCVCRGNGNSQSDESGMMLGCFAFVVLFGVSCHPKIMFEEKRHGGEPGVKRITLEKQEWVHYSVKDAQYQLCKKDILDGLYDPDSYDNKNFPKSRSISQIDDEEWEVYVRYSAKGRSGKRKHYEVACISKMEFRGNERHKAILTP